LFDVVFQGCKLFEDKNRVSGLKILYFTKMGLSLFQNFKAMIKNVFILLVAMLLPVMGAFAQQKMSITAPDAEEGVFKQHQIYLEKPAQSIKNLQQKDGTPLKGELSEDGKRIIINNYQKKSGVTVEVLYPDGATETISRSPCFIDPIIPL